MEYYPLQGERDFGCQVLEAKASFKSFTNSSTEHNIPCIDSFIHFRKILEQFQSGVHSQGNGGLTSPRIV